MKVQEGVVDVELARLLGDFGLGSAALVQFNGIPDVYLISRGLRVILEAKESGQEAQLRAQLAERIDRNLCDLAIGISYPRSVVSGLVAPSPKEVQSRLAKVDLSLLAFAQGDPTAQEISGERRFRVAQLPELISTLSNQALPEDQLENSVERVRKAVGDFTGLILSGSNPKELALNIKEVLEGGRETKTTKEEDLAGDVASGALILFNALAFYETLVPSESLRPFSQILSETGGWKAATTEAFARALHKNYEAVFVYGQKIVEALPSSPSIEAGIEAIYGAAQQVAARASLLRNDLSGRVYHSTLGRTVAKAYATFYTGIPAAELLAWLTIDSYKAKVADFASGSGTLLVASYHRKLALAYSEGYLGDVVELHRRFLHEDLWGFDAMPFASHLTMVNLAMQQPTATFRDSRVYNVPCGGNRLGSLDLLRTDTIGVQRRIGGQPSLGAMEHAISGKKGLTSLRVPRQGFDLIIMNPPFTRNDRASRVLDRKELRAVLENRGWSLSEAGLASPFIRLSGLEVAPTGRIAFVLPSAVLSRDTWLDIRETLLSDYDVEYLILSWAPNRSAFSEGASFREVLVVAKKSVESETGSELRSRVPKGTILVHLDRELSVMDARDVAIALRRFAANPSPFDFVTGSPAPILRGVEALGSVVSIPVGLLSRGVDNWYRFGAFRNVDLQRFALYLEGLLPRSASPVDFEIAHLLSPLGEVADVKLFMKNVESAGYKVYDSDPGPGGIRFVEGTQLGHFAVAESELSWLKYDPNLPKSETFEAQSGSLLVVRKTNIFSSTRVTAATSLAQPATSGMWYPVKPNGCSSLDGKEVRAEEVAKLLTLWFNSSFGLVSLLGEREETEGAYMEWKTERMRAVRALDPSLLNRNQIDGILASWDELSSVSWPLLRDQISESALESESSREKLDRVLVEALTPDSSLDLKDLHAKLGSEIRLLRDLMSRASTRESSSNQSNTVVN